MSLRTRRSWKDGQARHQGTLDDYANLAEGLLTLYETTFEERFFLAARGLADTILARFTAPDGGFFDTADDAEAFLIDEVIQGRAPLARIATWIEEHLEPGALD